MRLWLTGQKTYEGFPLFLRRPAEFDIAALRSMYPNLVVVTHEFAKRLPNGLPEPDYNHGLLEMDGKIIAAFDVNRMGVAALIETFGGKRHYYFYVSLDADVTATISAIARRYPTEKLSWTARPDPNWGFIQDYARDHF